MCGITGFCNHNWDRLKTITRMNDAIIHRGPDEGGYWLDNNSGMTLGHRRLSIIDLSENGSQPMISHNERYVLVYNGEIYNALLVKKQLENQKGKIDFKGSSDTEILLEAFCIYGVRKTLEMTNGMFAFALYDRQTRTITMARDRIGEKPLYYGHVKDTFVFASDISSICKVPDFNNAISLKAVKAFLRYGYVPTPLSIYENIYKCRPGHILESEYPYSEFKDTAYYSLIEEYRNAKEEPFRGTFPEAVDELEKYLKRAVTNQMVADVPIGAFLSGGIDSSVIVSMMQSQSEKPVRTFTIGFEDPQFDESEEAEVVASHLGTHHTCLKISQQELQKIIPQIPQMFTEPFADSSQIPTYLVSKLARENVTVSLSGDAGDELFCGYNTYWKIAALNAKIKKIPYGIRKTTGNVITHSFLKYNNTLYRGAHSLFADNIAGLHEAVCYDMTDLTEQLLMKSGEEQKKDMVTNSHNLLEAEDEMMLRDLCGYHPDDILVKVDRTGMFVSLENRVPMLDKDLLRFAYSLPIPYKYSDGISKRVLKEVLYRYVPKEIVERPKKGFSVPLKQWLSEGNVHEWAKELLLNSTLVKDGIINGTILEKLWTKFMQTGQNKTLLWNVIILEQWYQSQKNMRYSQNE